MVSSIIYELFRLFCQNQKYYNYSHKLWLISKTVYYCKIYSCIHIDNMSLNSLTLIHWQYTKLIFIHQQLFFCIVNHNIFYHNIIYNNQLCVNNSNNVILYLWTWLGATWWKPNLNLQNDINASNEKPCYGYVVKCTLFELLHVL